VAADSERLLVLLNLSGNKLTGGLLPRVLASHCLARVGGSSAFRRPARFGSWLLEVVYSRRTHAPGVLLLCFQSHLCCCCCSCCSCQPAVSQPACALDAPSAILQPVVTQVTTHPPLAAAAAACAGPLSPSVTSTAPHLSFLDLSHNGLSGSLEAFAAALAPTNQLLQVMVGGAEAHVAHVPPTFESCGCQVQNLFIVLLHWLEQANLDATP
jgi:hypothetical protein